MHSYIFCHIPDLKSLAYNEGRDGNESGWWGWPGVGWGGGRMAGGGGWGVERGGLKSDKSNSTALTRTRRGCPGRGGGR